jgi:hypothetical protein
MLAALIGWTAVLSHAFLERVHAVRAAPSVPAAVSCGAFGLLFLLGAGLPVWSGRAEIHGLPELSHAVRESILDPTLDPVMGPDRHVLLVGAVDPTTTIYVPLVRSFHGRRVPASCQLLMQGWGPVRLTRVSPTAFELLRLNRNWTAPDVYADAFTRTPPEPGRHFHSGLFEAEVLSVHDGRPLRVRYELHLPLEGPFTLIVQTEHGLRQLPFPRIGQATVLEPAQLPMRMGQR